MRSRTEGGVPLVLLGPPESGILMLARTVVLAALLLPALAIRVTAATPAVGDRAPEFRLSSPDGTPVSLSSLTAKGKVVLIALRGYPGYQCPYCMKQVHDFTASAGKFAADGAEILLVYPGPPDALAAHAKEFLAKQDLPANVHLVIDPDYTFTNQYGLRWDAPHETAYPSTFLIGKDGKVFFEKISHSHGDRTSAAETLTELEKSNPGQ